MPLSSNASIDRRAIIARLRAAGCVFAEDEAALLIDAAQTADELEGMVVRRVAGLPLEHVVGWADFCGIRVSVDPGVFVPRHRSELLVREAAKVVRAGAVVVDMCCGSGALGLALVAMAGPLELHATDIDAHAAACAGRNLDAVDGRVYCGDLFEPLPEELRGRVDVLVANTPYVPSDDVELLPHEARDHEPRLALDGGVDGLDVQRRVAASAPAWLAPGGHVLMETSAGQARAAVGILVAAGLRTRVATLDELEATVVVGTHPAARRGRRSA